MHAAPSPFSFFTFFLHQNSPPFTTHLQHPSSTIIQTAPLHNNHLSAHPSPLLLLPFSSSSSPFLPILFSTVGPRPHLGRRHLQPIAIADAVPCHQAANSSRFHPPSEATIESHQVKLITRHMSRAPFVRHILWRSRIIFAKHYFEKKMNKKARNRGASNESDDPNLPSVFHKYGGYATRKERKDLRMGDRLSLPLPDIRQILPWWISPRQLPLTAVHTPSLALIPNVG
ncbi:hypothetical protein AKJ16_DCAP08818 [Drosera capensis]